MCSDGSICCGLKDDNCCTVRKGFWLLNETVYPYGARPSGIAWTAPSIISSGPSSNWNDSSAASLATGSSEAHSKTPLRVGVGVDIGVGIPALLAITVGIFLHFRRQSQQPATKDADTLSHIGEETLIAFKQAGNSYNPSGGGTTYDGTEEGLANTLRSRELDSNQYPRELDTASAP
jgi:hypothetical protein